jgi:hypothetical protein
MQETGRKEKKGSSDRNRKNDKERINRDLDRNLYMTDKVEGRSKGDFSLSPSDRENDGGVRKIRLSRAKQF